MKRNTVGRFYTNSVEGLKKKKKRRKKIRPKEVKKGEKEKHKEGETNDSHKINC